MDCKFLAGTDYVFLTQHYPPTTLYSAWHTGEAHQIHVEWLHEWLSSLTLHILPELRLPPLILYTSLQFLVQFCLIVTTHAKQMLLVLYVHPYATHSTVALNDIPSSGNFSKI